MNRFFRVVFNERLSSWVVVSEMAKASGKKSGAVRDLSSPVNHHSHLNGVSHFSGSLKQGLWRFAPLSLAIWGIFITPAQAATHPLDYVLDDTDNSITCNIQGSTQPLNTVSNGASVIGVGNTADGQGSLVLGKDNTLSGASSTAVGMSNTVNAVTSSAWGVGNEIEIRISNPTILSKVRILQLLVRKV